MQEPITTFRHHLAYEAVVECRILHEYVNDGPCRALDIRPTPGTAAKLRGLGLLFRTLPDGFLLIADAARDWSNPVYQRPEVFEFSFRVNDPQFLRYTEIPYLSGQFHVFDALGRADGTLHPGPFVDGSTRTDADTDGIGGIIRLHHQEGSPILPSPGTAPSELAQPLRSHLIRFQARRAFLRYIFTHKNQSTEDFGNYFIENFEVNNALYKFTGPRVMELRNGRAGFDIRSTEPIPLRKSFESRGNLRRKRVNGLPFEYRRTLPMPRPENIIQDPLTDTFICEMLVNL
jgi:hypothetical protein